MSDDEESSTTTASDTSSSSSVSATPRKNEERDEEDTKSRQGRTLSEELKRTFDEDGDNPTETLIMSNETRMEVIASRKLEGFVDELSATEFGVLRKIMRNKELRGILTSGDDSGLYRELVSSA